MKRRLILITLCALIAIPSPAQTPVSAADLEYATQVALAQGVLALKQAAGKDPQGWIIPPIQKMSLTGYKDVMRKYRMVEKEVPVYEYKEIVVLVPGASPSDPPTKQVRQQPTKQIGTRKESYFQWDPTGPLEKIDKQPIWEQSGDTSWNFTIIGDSAMALCALRAAGVPEGDPVMQRMMENLFFFLDTYGPPDQTWNLTWLAVVMAKTEGAVAAQWTEKLASRLLDGQITDGPALGLWGPMSLNTRLFSVLMRDYLAADAELAKRVAKHKEQPTKAKQALVDETEVVRNRLKSYADSWSPAALRFAKVEFPLVWKDQTTNRVYWLGSPDYFYNQRSADMESTWAALHALSVCAEMKRLPKDSLRPVIPPSLNAAKAAQAEVSTLNAKTVPPTNALAALAAAANALAALQSENGAWGECNFHQPVTDFDAFSPSVAVPADKASFPPLASPVTITSSTQGIAALDSIGRAVGMERLAKFQPKYIAGVQGRATTQQDWIKTISANPKQPLKPDMYLHFLAAARPLLQEASDATTADALTRLLILGGDADGGWGSGSQRAYVSSSSRERHKVMEKLPGQNWGGWSLGLAVDMNKAHFSRYNVEPSIFNSSPGSPYATAIAVHYLASRLKDPAASLQPVLTNPALPELRKGINALLLGAPKSPP